MKRTIYTILFLVAFFANSQTNYVQINPNIVLPKDSITSKSLTASLNEFLLAAQKSNEKNKFVFEKEKIETFLLLDELLGIEKSGKYKDDYFYKPYLTNVVLLNDNTYLIQVSYIGTNEKTALLRASFEFIAHKTDSYFTFSSPLLKNTKNWKVKKLGNIIFHYQNTINKNKVKEFTKLTTLFDTKLKVTNIQSDYYLCENFVDLQKCIGINYKSDYNGETENVCSTSIGNRNLVVMGNNNGTFNEFDPHDLFHDRLSLVISRDKVNKPVDEGCAYLYGGSWGFSWKEIFKAFKEQIANNQNTNWMELKETPLSFKTGNFPNQADNIVNALLVQKIEKDKGFAGVWEFLNVGPFEKGNEKYYQALEKLTGISKANYNEKIWELVNNER